LWEDGENVAYHRTEDHPHFKARASFDPTRGYQAVPILVATRTSPRLEAAASEPPDKAQLAELYPLAAAQDALEELAEALEQLQPRTVRPEPSVGVWKP
jgi:hypothetical protein